MHLVPKAAADRVIGIVAAAPSGAMLKAAVTAAPESGKANAALIRLLAKHFDLAPRDIAIVGGHGNRRKVIEFAGDPAILGPQIAQKLPQDKA